MLVCFHATERPGKLASLLHQAGRTTGAIAAQIEESLAAPLEPITIPLVEDSAATAATTTNIVPPEQVTLVGDDWDPSYSDLINGKHYRYWDNI